MDKPTLVLIGSAGSGKGTQSKLIVEKLGYHLVEAGQIFRDTAKKDTKIGRHVAALDKEGKHASDELITQLIEDYVKGVPLDQPLLIDGYPRSVGQALLLDKLLEESDRDVNNVVVIWIKVSPQEAERRLMNRTRCEVCKTVFNSRDIKTCPKCGGKVSPRIYDTPEGIRNRLDFFKTTTMPAIEMYRERGNLVEINGEQEIEGVFQELRDKLENYGNS